MVSSSRPKAMWAGRVRRAGIRRWPKVGPPRWRGARASLSEEGRKDMQAGPPRGGALVHHSWTISSGNSPLHGFKFRARGKGGLDESGVQECAGGPLRDHHSRRAARRICRRARHGGGRSCVTPGQHSRNNQCFKL